MIFRQNILATLVYYDVFDWPLKAAEVFAKMVKFDHLGSSQHTAYGLQQEIDLTDIKKELDQLVLERIVDCQEKFYFLFNREYLVPLRLKQEKIAKRKWRIAKRTIWWLRFMPYVCAVFASGSLAMRNTDELSDLDVLIVVKHGRIWLSRFLILGILTLIGKRRKGTDRMAPDKICPNHFITDRSLAIPFKSIYNAQTYANLAPIYVRDADLIEKFKKANSWVLDYVKEWNLESGIWNLENDEKEVEPLSRGSTSKFTGSVEVKPQQHPMFGSSTSKHWVEAVERVLDWLDIAGILEKLLGQYQSRRISRNPITHQTGGRVIFTNEQLEFHPHSIEASVINKYNKNLEELGMSNLAIEHDSGLTP